MASPSSTESVAADSYPYPTAAKPVAIAVGGGGTAVAAWKSAASSRLSSSARFSVRCRPGRCAATTGTTATQRKILSGPSCRTCIASASPRTTVGGVPAAPGPGPGPEPPELEREVEAAEARAADVGEVDEGEGEPPGGEGGLTPALKWSGVVGEGGSSSLTRGEWVGESDSRDAVACDWCGGGGVCPPDPVPRTTGENSFTLAVAGPVACAPMPRTQPNAERSDQAFSRSDVYTKQDEPPLSLVYDRFAAIRKIEPGGGDPEGWLGAGAGHQSLSRSRGPIITRCMRYTVELRSVDRIR